jgi:hypothetical protein
MCTSCGCGFIVLSVKLVMDSWASSLLRSGMLPCQPANMQSSSEGSSLVQVSTQVAFNDVLHGVHQGQRFVM